MIIIEAADGGEIYFHRNAVLDGASTAWSSGRMVFVEEEGDEARRRAPSTSSANATPPRGAGLTGNVHESNLS